MGECLIVRRGGESYELPELNESYPADVSVIQAAAASASFSVSITTPGRPAEYSYQWYVDGLAVSGATNSGYVHSGLTTVAAYTVYCTVTNKAGTVTSRAAALTVTSAKPTYTYTGSHQLISDSTDNWRIKFLTSGTLRFTSLGNAGSGVEVFVVGAGGGTTSGGGAGGGYTKTQKGLTVAANTNYSIVIGSGGTVGGNGGSSSALGVSATGGYGTTTNAGANGGSGGGSWSSGNGGDNGGNGGAGGQGGGPGGTGQGTTTREFGETSGTRYAGGGGAHPSGSGGAGGGGAAGSSGTVNTGGGGGGDMNPGGSGIVIIRNKR